MKKEIADKWVKALRSGKYKQGKGLLCKVEGKTAKYCCLGVLCHILGINYVKHENCKIYGGRSSVLPLFVMEQTAIRTSEAWLSPNSNADDRLSWLNDHGNKTFKEIANIIENNWESL